MAALTPPASTISTKSTTEIGTPMGSVRATAGAADKDEPTSDGWLGLVACLPCRPSASRVLHKLRIPFGDGLRPPLTPSLWRHGNRQEGQARACPDNRPPRTAQVPTIERTPKR